MDKALVQAKLSGLMLRREGLLHSLEKLEAQVAVLREVLREDDEAAGVQGARAQGKGLLAKGGAEFKRRETVSYKPFLRELAAHFARVAPQPVDYAEMAKVADLMQLKIPLETLRAVMWQWRRKGWVVAVERGVFVAGEGLGDEG